MEIEEFLKEIGSDSRRIAVEYVNPTLTQLLLRLGFEVIDAVAVTEEARIIKSSDEVECIRWAVAVAEDGLAQLNASRRPGVTELHWQRRRWDSL